jgi:hypothetical protein
VFLQPSLESSFEEIMREATQLTSCIADLVVCIILLLPLVITGMSEPSIPYYSVALKWFVPCPKPISRVDRFLTVFDSFVWLKMIIVFVLTLTRGIDCANLKTCLIQRWLMATLLLFLPHNTPITSLMN